MCEFLVLIFTSFFVFGQSNEITFCPHFLKVKLEDPIENIGAKLVRQAVAKTNDLAGDGTTTSVVLAQGLIVEGVKVCSLLYTSFSFDRNEVLVPNLLSTRQSENK